VKDPKFFTLFNLRLENNRINTKPDRDYDVPLSPEDKVRLRKIIDEAKVKFKK